MSYHFYDMGYKDGYKKAKQDLAEQAKKDAKNLDEQLSGGGIPLGGADAKYAHNPSWQGIQGVGGRGGRGRQSGGGIGGNQFQTATGVRRPGGGMRRPAGGGNEFFTAQGGMIPYTQPGGFPPPRPGSPLEPYWVPPVPTTPGNPGTPGYYNVPSEYDFNGDGVIDQNEWDQFRRDLGIPFSNMPIM